MQLNIKLLLIIAGKDQDTINFENGKSLRVSTKELSKILSKNTLNGERVTFEYL